MKITDTLEVRLASLLEEAGYKDHEDMDGEDFQSLLDFIHYELDKEKWIRWWVGYRAGLFKFRANLDEIRSLTQLAYLLSKIDEHATEIDEVIRSHSELR